MLLKAIRVVFLGWLQRLKYWSLLKIMNQNDYKLAEEKRHTYKNSVLDLILCMLWSHLQYFKMGHSHFYSDILGSRQSGLLSSACSKAGTKSCSPFPWLKTLLSSHIWGMSANSIWCTCFRIPIEWRKQSLLQNDPFDHFWFIMCLP